MLTCVLSKLVRVMLVKLNLASRLKRQSGCEAIRNSRSIPVTQNHEFLSAV